MIPIDYSKLPAPDVLEEIIFEVLLARYEEKMLELWPQWEGRGIKADPIQRQIILDAFLETWIRGRVNDAAKALILAKATGSDLDHFAVAFGVSRLVYDPGDPNSFPPRLPETETDEAFRARVQLAPEAFNTAGCADGYRFHGLTAGIESPTISVETPAPGKVVVTYSFDPNSLAAQVKDCTVVRTQPGYVTITVMSRINTGIPSPELLDQVNTAVSAKTVRPIADYVVVQPCELVPYKVKARGYANTGDINQAQAQGIDQANRYTSERHALGTTVARSALMRQLHVAGAFSRVELLEPASDIICSPFQAPVCTEMVFEVVS